MSLLRDLLVFARQAPHHPLLACRQLFVSQWARFGLIGALSSLVYYLCGLLLVNGFKLNLLAGNTLAYVISFAVSYLGQTYWTFKTDRPLRETLPRFAMVQLVALFFNSFIIEILCRRFSAPYPLAMLVAIIIVPACVYVVFKYWIFRKVKAK